MSDKVNSPYATRDAANDAMGEEIERHPIGGVPSSNGRLPIIRRLQMSQHTVSCLECDHEIPATVEYVEEGYCNEGEKYLDVPDECPNCGASTADGSEPSAREDFHSDG
jgi:hypothetical protein